MVLFWGCIDCDPVLVDSKLDTHRFYTQHYLTSLQRVCIRIELEYCYKDKSLLCAACVKEIHLKKLCLCHYSRKSRT